RPLEGVFLKVIEHLAMLKEARERASGTRPLVLAIDIPSGLDADKPKPIGPAVEADLTVTFTAAKLANVLSPACDFGGELIVADIGSPASLIQAARPWLFLTEAEDARAWLVSTRYTPESYKNTHGHVLLAAGSRGYSGAAALSGNADAIRRGTRHCGYAGLGAGFGRRCSDTGSDHDGAGRNRSRRDQRRSSRAFSKVGAEDDSGGRWSRFDD